MSGQAMSARRAAIFLDKDGTLLDDVPFNTDPRYMAWAPGAQEGVTLLAQLGYPLVVVSNQPGLALGYFDTRSLKTMQAHLVRLFDQAGARLAGMYCCVHHPHGQVASLAVRCQCRKPAPGLLLRAARDLDLDLAASWMVGDILDDVEAGHRAGCRSVLVDVGNETQWLAGPGRTPDWCVTSVLEMAWRLKAQGGQSHATF